jgi:hypothetical protein
MVLHLRLATCSASLPCCCRGNQELLRPTVQLMFEALQRDVLVACSASCSRVSQGFVDNKQQ